MSAEAAAASNAASEPTVTQTTEQPVTPQAAPASTPESVKVEPAKSAREAVERAFAKVTTPEDQSAVTGTVADKNRDATGKFIAKDKTEEPAKAADAQIEKVTEAVAAAIAAPTRFTKEAQAEWAKAPPLVQQEVARAINELTQGIDKYRPDAEAFAPFKQFADLAKQYNVQPETALQGYIEIDKLWGSNPVQAFFETCRRTNVPPQALLAAITAQHGAQQPGQQQPNQLDSRDVELRELRNQIAALTNGFGEVKQTITQQTERAALNQVQQTIVEFTKAHPFVAELEGDMALLIESKRAKDLSDAYDKALLLNPEVNAKAQADKAAKEAAKNPPQQGSNPKAALSVTGTPSTASNASSKPAGSPREALTRAFAQVGA